jgi:hypothetical protein
MKLTRSGPPPKIAKVGILPPFLVAIEAKVIKAINHATTHIVCAILLLILVYAGFALGIWQEVLSHL